MTQPAKSQEPSMEEILASIRRIIADDDAGKTTQRPAEPPKPSVRTAAPPRAPLNPPPPARSEHDALDGPADQAAMDRAVEDQASDILDLTESMAAPTFGQPEAPAAPKPNPTPVSPPQFRRIEGYSDVSFDEAEPAPAVQNAPGPRPAVEREQLISRSTSAAVDSAFNALAQTVLVQNARTLEDLVREMLRPLLKSWLDDNLPGLVERLVRAEIERVARGR